VFATSKEAKSFINKKDDMANNKEKRDKIFKEIETLLKDARIELEKKMTEDDRKDGNKTCC
jgi:hypothetical protein